MEDIEPFAMTGRVAKALDDDFDDFVERNIDRVFRIAVAILSNSSDAQDATQEVFVRAWKHRASLRDASRADAWLRTIVVNVCRSHLKRRRPRLDSVVDECAADGVATPSHDPYDGDEELVLAAMGALTHEHRLVLILRYVDGHGTDEVARSLGISPGTARSRIHYGLRALRAQFDSMKRGQQR